MAICLLGSKNTALVPFKDAITELLPAIVRKATEEDEIHIIDDIAAKLDFKLKEEFDWNNPFELSEHMLKNVYATNTIKQWSFSACLY
jgi:signal recognition particle subunit SEC65